LAWITNGTEIYRTAKPEVPPKHADDTLPSATPFDLLVVHAEFIAKGHMLYSAE
jgi:hypothetical protein